MGSTTTCNQGPGLVPAPRKRYCAVQSSGSLDCLLPVALTSIPSADHAMEGQAEPKPVGRASTVTRTNVLCQGFSASVGEMYKLKARVLN